MLQTRFTDAYGTELPIVSAGMAFISRALLTAAVSEAGGLGTLGAAAMPPELLEAEIEAIRDRTDRPFAVNFIPRFVEDAQIDVCVSARVPIVTFFWDDPRPEWIDALKAAGTRVWMQVGSIVEAEAAISAGFDAVIAQGEEAGGHNRSTAPTRALVPAVIDAVAPAIVLAAGGIADGRGLADVLDLGADAAVLGTRFVVSDEADAHPEYQERIIAAGSGDTARHWIFGLDWPDASVRGLRNAIVREFEGRDQPPPYHELDAAEQPVVGTANVFGRELPLTRFSGLPPTRGASGDFEQMSLLAGEGVALISSRAPAGELVRQIADEAAAVLSAS
jgi:NAD(P)H-dependent flavin oxidoreductase YrpB (nitropropane dioxygenase family)